MTRRNSSNRYDHYVLLFNDGSTKICKSDASYNRFVRNNDLSLLQSVHYNGIRQSQEYLTWLKNQSFS